jgi:hypothetical protein
MRFLPIGWAKFYEFNENDLVVLSNIVTRLSERNEISLEAVHSLVYETV